MHDNQEIDVNQLQELTANLSADNWAESVRRLVGTANDIPGTLYDITTNGRFAWKVLLDLRRDGVLLDLGCGFGNLTQNLAPHVAKVFALGFNQPQLEFAQKRFSIFNREDDITCVCGDNSGRLPFADETFDYVTLSSLFGLMNEGDIASNSARLESMRNTSITTEHRGRKRPRTAYQNILWEANRVLKPDGQLFIAAENLLDPARLSSLSDCAPRLLRGSALLRAITTPYFVWKKRQTYPIYNYSALSYRRQMKASGFAKTTFFGLMGHKSLDEIRPLDSETDVAESGKQPIKQRIKNHKLFLPAYGIIATKTEQPQSSTQARLFEQISRQLSVNRTSSPLIAQRHIITRKDKMIILAKLGDRPVVVRFPFGEAANAAEDRNSKMLTWMTGDDRKLEISPKILADGRVDGVVYRVESMMPGRPLRAALIEQGRCSMLGEIEDLLELLNPRDTRATKPLEGTLYEQLVDARLRRLFAVVTETSDQDRLRNFFRTHLYGAAMPVGLTHGDFSASNIYMSGGHITGIIDWESGSREDLPVLDAISYLESTHRTFNRNHRISDSIATLASLKFQQKEEEQFLFAIYERLGLDRKHHLGLVYLRWLRLVDYLLPYWLNYNPAGQQTYIHQVVRNIPPQN